MLQRIKNLFKAKETPVTVQADAQKQYITESQWRELKAAQSASELARKVIDKYAPSTRGDIRNWLDAVASAKDTDNPLRVDLARIYEEISNDALLTSQVENRIEATLGNNRHLKKSGKRDDFATAEMLKLPAVKQMIAAAIKSKLTGPKLLEFYFDENGLLQTETLPFENCYPAQGYFIPDAQNNSKTSRIYYRTQPDYGTWIVEVGDRKEIGILNKAVPHALFKKFAQSCWSELCEIYGIPPRYVKTNTQDPAMVSRASQMMRDMGAAAWFIIDKNEEFNFATMTETKGDVYANLINTCNSEMSMLISGAIIGQDTVNGNRSKDESAQDMLAKLVKADQSFVAEWMNNVGIPALQRLGALPKGEYTFDFDEDIDIEALWNKIIGILPYYEIDSEWLTNKFGIPAVKKAAIPSGNQSAGDFFA